MLHISREQFFIFLVTIAVTIIEDLLWGIIAGIVVKLVLHVVRGAPLSVLFKPSVVVEDSDPNTVRLKVQKAAVFSNYIGLKRIIQAVPAPRNVVIDFSSARLVDHSTMQYMQETAAEFAHAGRVFTITGLEHHRPDSAYPTAARRLVA
jgi:MFS superfamily sulfate permease-like transporter